MSKGQASTPTPPANEPICPGDLVRIVRNCDCNPTRGLGYIFRVEKVEPALNWECRRCKNVIRDERPLAFGRVSVGEGWHPVAWLRRIPPLAELEGEDRKEEVHA